MCVRQFGGCASVFYPGDNCKVWLVNKNKFPWRGAPDAGVVLGIIAVLWALSVVITGFVSH